METNGATEPHEGYRFEDLAVGMTARFARVIGDDAVRQFAEISGDDNPLHLDDDYAAGTFFKGRVAHGMCTAALISTVLGTRLPGPGCVYLSQNLRFMAPVRPGDEVVATATVSDLMPEKNRAKFQTVCTVGDRVVVDGEALIQVPSRN